MAERQPAGEAQFDEQAVAVARVYALALLQLAQRNNEEEAVLEEFDAMLEQFDGQPGFERLLGDPAIDESERAAILERVLRDRANDLVVNTLQVMNRKGRSELLRPLVQAYREELAKLQQVVEAKAITAVPITDDIRARLIDALSRRTGKKIVLRESVDESLIGGMVLRLGDRKIDASIARELWRRSARLRERASEDLLTASMTEQ